MKKLLLIFLFLSTSLSQTTPSYEKLRNNLLEFDTHYIKFISLYAGCGESLNKPCNPNKSIIDYKSFHLAREGAKKLFDLKD